MATVFPLIHWPITADFDTLDLDEATEAQERWVGIYSTREKAEAAIRRLQDKPGFHDWPGGFRIYEAHPGDDAGQEGFIDPFDDPDWPKEDS